MSLQAVLQQYRHVLLHCLNKSVHTLFLSDSAYNKHPNFMKYSHWYELENEYLLYSHALEAIQIEISRGG